MEYFWYFSALLIVIALSFVVLPWVLKNTRQEQDVLSNTQVIKQRIEELQREVSEGLLSVEDKATAEKELKLALLGEVGEAKSSQSNAKLPLLVGGVLTLAVGTGIYIHANQIEELNRWDDSMQNLSTLAQRIVIEADPTVGARELEDFALGLRTKLIEKPDDVTGWLLLGRLYSSLNQVESAILAFEQGYLIDPNHTGLLSSYGQTLIMTGQEEYMRQGEQYLLRLLQIDAQNADALGLLAVSATQLGENDKAIAHWTQLKALMSEGEPMRAEIDKRIASLSGETVSQTSVSINVELAEELVSKLPEDGYLFVFAQDALSEVRMPAAVVKSKLSTMPLQVTLSDANAMMPTYKLSQLTEIRLIARISKDENVAQATGELQGEVVVTLSQGKNILQNITIDKELL